MSLVARFRSISQVVTQQQLQLGRFLVSSRAPTGSLPLQRPGPQHSISVRAIFQWPNGSHPIEEAGTPTAASSPPATNHTSTRSQFSTQADIMDRLGISNDRVRPSHRTTAPPLSNQSRRRRRFPIRQSEPRPGALYPIKAMHIAQTIDLDAVMQTILCDNMEKRKLFGKNSLVVELAAQAHPEPPRFVAVFRFGSIVFLNVPTKDAAVLTERIRKVSTDAVKTGTERRENFGVMVQPEGLYPTSVPLPELVVTADYCIVPEVDINGVAVISNIMAQTVALDSYNDTVDTLLSKFAGINSAVRATGTFQSSDRTFLFKTVAQNNAIFIDMVSKTRLKDRSDTAWTMTRYETIHYGLKSEFEIDNRFNQIEYKLNLIQQNAKFFLEVMQHQKSNSLEWIIVLLIGAECVIMCIDMSGMGEPFFRSLGLVS